MKTENDYLVEELTWACDQLRNCRGAISSGQMTDKDVSGSLLRILDRLGGLITFIKNTPIPTDSEAEIQRLQDAKRRALAIADERAKENVALRAALAAPASEGVRNAIIEECAQTALAAIPLLQMGKVDASEFCDAIQDEIVFAIRALQTAPEPTDTPDEGPDPLGYAKGEKA